MAAQKITEGQWELAKQRYITDPDASHSKIAQMLDCSANLVSRRAKKEGWVKGILAPRGVEIELDAVRVGDAHTSKHDVAEPTQFLQSVEAGPTRVPSADSEDANNEPEAPRARVTVIYPEGFQQPKPRLIASEVVDRPPKAPKGQGLFSAFPSVDGLLGKSVRSGQSLVRTWSIDRVFGALERRRQRIVALDTAFVRAMKSGDPKAAQAVLNLAKAQREIESMESKYLLDEQEAHLDLIAKSRDVAAPPEEEPKARPVDDDEETFRAEMEERQRANGTYSEKLPPGWR